MKKTLSIILIIILCLSVFTACGKSQATKDAEAAIAAIGEVTIDSGEAIANAEKLYGILTDKEKEKVENRIELANAQEAFIKEQEAFAEQQAEIIYKNAKDAYTQLNEVAEICMTGMDDIYGAWYYGIYEADDYGDYESLFYSNFERETATLTEEELKAAGEVLGFDTWLIASDFEFCLRVAQIAISTKGTYDEIAAKMIAAENTLQDLTTTYDDYTYYPKLKEYYSAVSSYVDFFTSPSGSFQQLSDTINNYETTIRTYQSDVGFLFTK